MTTTCCTWLSVPPEEDELDPEEPELLELEEEDPPELEPELLLLLSSQALRPSSSARASGATRYARFIEIIPCVAKRKKGLHPEKYREQLLHEDVALMSAVPAAPVTCLTWNPVKQAPLCDPCSCSGLPRTAGPPCWPLQWLRPARSPPAARHRRPPPPPTGPPQRHCRQRRKRRSTR